MSKELEALKAAAVALNASPLSPDSLSLREDVCRAAIAFAESLKPKNTCAGCRSFVGVVYGGELGMPGMCGLRGPEGSDTHKHATCEHFAAKIELGE